MCLNIIFQYPWMKFKIRQIKQITVPILIQILYNANRKS